VRRREPFSGASWTGSWVASPRRAERDSGSAISVGYVMADRPAGIRPTQYQGQTTVSVGVRISRASSRGASRRAPKAEASNSKLIVVATNLPGGGSSCPHSAHRASSGNGTASKGSTATSASSTKLA
jgi:hypothetical protein